MKKILNRVSKGAVAALLMLSAVGCEDYLEKQPLDGFSDVSIYADKNLTFAYLSECYNYMFIGFQDGFNQYGGGYATSGNGNASNLTLYADNGRSKSAWVSANKYGKGIMTASSNFYNNWEPNYKGIYKCNTLLAGLDEYSQLTEADEARFRAEARFIRASLYFHLTIRFGNIPLIKEAQDIKGDLMTAQSPQSEVYDFVASEFAAAAEGLPSAKDLPSAEYGRATKEACWAFQGRTLLFAKRWAESAAASKKVIDSQAFDLEDDYSKICHLTVADRSCESVFDILFDGVKKWTGIDNYASPSVAGGGTSFYNPTQELVDEYETLNGLNIWDDPTYDDKNAPYANRDLRLDATIVHHGMEYRGKVTDFSVTKTVKDGVVTYKGNNTDSYGGGSLSSVTGYYYNKFCSTGGTAIKEYSGTWTELRYAEVLLNYVEAVNQDKGANAEVYKYMDKIRVRAGLPTLTAVRPNQSKTEMIEEILHERRVELALQSNRFWDLMRYDRLVSTLDGLNSTGMAAVKDAAGNITYDRIKTPYTLVFPEKYKLFPIPFSEMNKNPNLVQNPGY